MESTICILPCQSRLTLTNRAMGIVPPNAVRPPRSSLLPRDAALKGLHPSSQQRKFERDRPINTPPLDTIVTPIDISFVELAADAFARDSSSKAIIYDDGRISYCVPILLMTSESPV